MYIEKIRHSSVLQVYRPISAEDTLKDCRAYLRSLPDVDSPELFGMHHCAEVAYLKTQAQLFVDAVVSTQPAVTTDTLIISGRRSQDEIVLEIASDILIRLPLTVEDTGCAPEPKDDVSEKIAFGSFKAGPVWAALMKAAEGPGSFIKSTLLTVLHQEIDQYNNLLAIIIKSLHALQQGIKGEIIFTTGIEELYNSILKAKVPELWQSIVYVSSLETVVFGILTYTVYKSYIEYKARSLLEKYIERKLCEGSSWNALDVTQKAKVAILTKPKSILSFAYLDEVPGIEREGGWGAGRELCVPSAAVPLCLLSEATSIGRS
ncbi:Dynein heavy chain 14, axonemal [Varanus komodoensis]|nr:Dynein heavy chain 14, axonemal [Varanus komodoensis]